MIISIHDGAKSKTKNKNKKQKTKKFQKMEEGALSLQQKWEILAENCEINANSGS